MNQPELSIVVFAYNEHDNVAPVLSELLDWLRETGIEFEIVFVDDGSTDTTSDSARLALRSTSSQIVRHDTNRGIGAALKSGVIAARGDWVTFMPCDGQIPPAAIGTLLDARDASIDVVFSIYEDRDDGVHRKFLSFSVRALIAAVHAVVVRSDGPYLFRRSLFDPDQLRPDSFFLNFEFPIRVVSSGLRSRVVTISCRRRRSGHSKSAQASRIAQVASDLFSLRVRRLEDLAARTTGRTSLRLPRFRMGTKS